MPQALVQSRRQGRLHRYTRRLNGPVGGIRSVRHHTPFAQEPPATRRRFPGSGQFPRFVRPPSPHESRHFPLPSCRSPNAHILERAGGKGDADAIPGEYAPLMAMVAKFCRALALSGLSLPAARPLVISWGRRRVIIPQCSWAPMPRGMKFQPAALLFTKVVFNVPGYPRWGMNPKRRNCPGCLVSPGQIPGRRPSPRTAKVETAFHRIHDYRLPPTFPSARAGRHHGME